jgi:hypothetical protein
MSFSRSSGKCKAFTPSRAMNVTPELSQLNRRDDLPTLAGIIARLAAVDEEEGVVWLRISFGPGSLFGREGTPMAWEMFKFQGGQIHAVEAFMEATPLGTESTGTGRPERRSWRGLR